VGSVVRSAALIFIWRQTYVEHQPRSWAISVWLNYGRFHGLRFKAAD
jgi:hypothetical protein